jgi:carboxylesterase
MRELGEFLRGQGHTVLGVRLSGHATNIDAMIRTRYQDWLASVEDGYNLLKNHCDHIFLIGLSMGGVLCLTQAARLPVTGVTAMSTPYYLPVGWVHRFPWAARLASKFLRTRKKNEGNWFNPELAENHISYARNPVRPGYELYKLIKGMQAELPNINIPALLIHSRDDNYILEDHAPKIFENLGSDEKQLIWVDNCSHVITRDGDTRKVFVPIAQFIQENI